jgi:hypothetical protein
MVYIRYLPAALIKSGSLDLGISASIDLQPSGSQSLAIESAGETGRVWPRLSLAPFSRFALPSRPPFMMNPSLVNPRCASVCTKPGILQPCGTRVLFPSEFFPRFLLLRMLACEVLVSVYVLCYLERVCGV